MSLAVLPGWISGVCLAVDLEVVRHGPTFLKTNVTVPGLAIDFVESLKQNSLPLT